MLLTLNEDIRVIIIKIADRLQHGRPWMQMHNKSSEKNCFETLYIYAPWHIALTL